MANERNLTLYRSPQWALVLELYLAFQAVLIGVLGGIHKGPLSATLHRLDEYYVWSTLFCSLGLCMLFTAALEMRCRRLGRPCDCIKRFAIARELFNVGLLPCWGFGMWLLFLSDYRLVLVPAISLQAFVAVLVIQWENVSAQRLKAEERRNGSVVYIGCHDRPGC